MRQRVADSAEQALGSAGRVPQGGVTKGLDLDAMLQADADRKCEIARVVRRIGRLLCGVEEDFAYLPVGAAVKSNRVERPGR